MSTKTHFSLLATSFAGGPRPRNAVLILSGLWLALFFAALFSPSVLDDADATHANAARAIVTTGHVVTLRVDGVRYLEKAPLPYWLTAISFRLFGFNTFATHLPQALAVLLLMLLGHRWANQAFGARTGFYTAIAILTSTGVFLFTRFLIPEVLLSLLLATALFAFIKSLGPIAAEPQLGAPLEQAVPSQAIAKPFPSSTAGSPGRTARVFASPTQGSIDLEDALRLSGGPEIERFIQAACEIEGEHHILMQHTPATGVWKGGAEPTVISNSESPLDEATLHAIAAIRGKAAHLDAVLVWQDDEDGPHTLYVIKLSGIPPARAADRVLASEIRNATVVQIADGTEVHIMDLDIGQRATAELERKLYEHFSDGIIQGQPGHGRILWRRAPAPDQSQWTFDQIIESYRRGSADLPPEQAANLDDHHEDAFRGTHAQLATGAHVLSGEGSVGKRWVPHGLQLKSSSAPLPPERPAEIFNAGPYFYPYVMWASLAFAVLAKGLVALVFFFATTLLYLLLIGEFKSSLRKLRPFTGLLLFLAIAVPWHILAALHNPATATHHGFLWFYFVNEHVLRFLGRRTPADFNKLPGWLFWASHLVWLFPWSLFLPLGATALWRRFAHQTHTLTRDANLLPPFQFVLALIVLALGAAFAGADLITAVLVVLTAYGMSLIAAQRKQTGFTFSPFHRIDPQQRTILLLALFAIVVLLFFSLSTNQEYYTFPAYLPLLLLIAATITRAEQTYSSSPEARRAIAIAHGLFIGLGLVAAVMLLYGVWSSRHLPFNPDIGTLLAHRGIGNYTLALSSLFDLTTQSFAALRLPAILAAFAFLLGPAIAWALRMQRRHIASTTTVAFTAAAFLIAAHIAFARFGPMLSSEQMAATIQRLAADHRISPDTQIFLFGDQSYGSSIPFYLGRQIPLVDGRSTSMLFGSQFADSASSFVTYNDLADQWGNGPRKILFVPAELRHQAAGLVRNRRFILQESSGKLLITDRPLEP